MCCNVTVIIPVYNAEKYIEKTILSVLEQTEKCKMIIVNDASTDGSAAIVQRYQEKYPSDIVYINKMINEGVSAARNDAIQMADTEFVAFLDADDWWDKEKIQAQLSKLKETEAIACYSGRELMYPDGKSMQKIVHVPVDISYTRLLKGNIIPCSSVVIKRSVALGYPMSHDELHEDYIMWLSMLKDGHKFIGIDEPYLKSRLDEGGKSRNKFKSALMTYKVYRYIGIPRHKAIYYFIHYIVNGIKKYT